MRVLRSICIILASAGSVSAAHPDLSVLDVASGVEPAELAEWMTCGETGFAVTNARISGPPSCAGRYSEVGDSIRGAILSSGRADAYPGSNDATDTTSGTGGAGDADLDALAGGATADACVLEFDVSTPSAEHVVLNYVFGSEEYNERVRYGFGDLAAVFVDGVNVATRAEDGAILSVDTRNAGNPLHCTDGLDADRKFKRPVEGETPRVRWRAVEVAGLGDEAAAVRGDLEPGDRIVALGAHLLHEGESVRLAEGAGAEHAAMADGGRP